MEYMKRTTARRFTDEFKIEVANFAVSHPEMNRQEIADSFDVSKTSVNDWINKFIYARQRKSSNNDKRNIVVESEEDVAYLTRENTRLKMENEILRRAMGILAKDTPPKGFTR
jgi:transposase